MRKSRILLGSLAGVCLLLANAIHAESPDQEALMGLEHKLAEAWLAGDADFVAQTEADEFVFTDPDGALSAKADDVASLKSGSSKFETMAFDDMRVLVFGDTAVVIGRATTKGSYLGKDFTGVLRFTDTWVRRDGRWQVVASQNTRLAQ